MVIFHCYVSLPEGKASTFFGVPISEPNPWWEFVTSVFYPPGCECTAPRMAVTRGHQAASAGSRSERIAPANSGNQVQLGYAWGWHILGAEDSEKKWKKQKWQPLVLWKIDHSLIFDETIFPFPSDNLPGKPIMCRSFSLGNHGYFSLLPMFTSRYI